MTMGTLQTVVKLTLAFLLHLQPKSQFYNSPEVMFRAAYGGFPGQSSLASNMAAFNTVQALSPMHEDTPQYKE